MNESKLTPAEVAALADKFEAAKIKGSIFSEEAKAVMVLDYNDGCAVSAEVYRRAVAAAVAAFPTTPAIKAHMASVAAKSARGLQMPEACDMSHFARAARSTVSQYHKARAAYTPKGGVPLVLKLKQAVRFGYSQEAYADMSTTLIPVDGDLSKVDRDTHANLSALVRMADTHTGWAGSGVNYSAALVTNEHGGFVEVTCRASIAD